MHARVFFPIPVLLKDDDVFVLVSEEVYVYYFFQPLY